MSEVTNEAVYNILQDLQQEQVELKATQQDMRAELQAIRIHLRAFQADINTLCTWVRGLDIRLERIECRLADE